MNNYDSQKTLELLEEKYTISRKSDPQEADLIILMTCSVREKAAEKIFSDLGLYQKLKKNYKGVLSRLLIAVGGCVASHYGPEISKRAPQVDIIFGPQNIQSLADLTENSWNSTEHEKTVEIRIQKTVQEKFAALAKLKRTEIKENQLSITIMEGCNNCCTYCAVPQARGAEVSRNFAEIINEIKNNITTEVALDLVFLGQNVNNYKYQDENGQQRLSDLLKEANKFEGICRIQFISSHPRYFGPDLINSYQKLQKLSSHLHLPVQSGSNSILQAMRRNYTIEEYCKLVESIRQLRPDLTLGTDIIVGFPGETQIDFEETCSLVEKIGFDSSYSFTYSPRPGTRAAKMETHQILGNRLSILQDLLQQTARKLWYNLVGTRRMALIDIVTKDQARTDHGKKIRLTKKATKEEIHLRRCPIEIIDLDKQKKELIGEICSLETP